MIGKLPKNPKSEFDKKLSSHYKKVNEYPDPQSPTDFVVF